MEAVKKALDKKAKQILDKERDDFITMLYSNPLSTHIKIQVGKEANGDDKYIKLLGDIFNQGTYGECWINNAIINEEDRKQEIIEEYLLSNKGKILDDIEGTNKSELNKVEEDKDIILEFLDNNLTQYSTKITDTIYAMSHGSYETNGNELGIFQNIVSSLSYIKQEYLRNNKK